MTLRPRPSSGEAQVEIAGSGRAARTIMPLAAPDYHVFEVTDLTILGGTDWSGAIGDENGPMLLGTLPFRAGQVVFHALQVEGSSTTTGVNVGLNVMESASIVNSVGVSSGASWAAFGAIVAAGANSLNEADPATDVEWNIVLRTDGPTSEDITINLARAAFLVI